MRYVIFLCLCACYMAVAQTDSSKVGAPRGFTARKDIREAGWKAKTIYAPDGRPAFQSQQGKGWHVIKGTAKLVAGTVTVVINTSPKDGKQDLSFTAVGSFKGTAWSLASGNTATYRVRPSSTYQAVITSSSGADTATVEYMLEGD